MFSRKAVVMTGVGRRSRLVIKIQEKTGSMWTIANVDKAAQRALAT